MNQFSFRLDDAVLKRALKPCYLKIPKNSYLRSLIMKRIHLFLLFLAFLLVVSCSKYQRLLKSSNYEKKYEAAVKYYEKQDYFRASTLLEELIPIFKGTKKSEKVYYYYAASQYGMGEYLMAAYHFENFIRTFPSSDSAEVCQYKIAYCYYLDSPVYSLDQTNTFKAITQIEIFINKYPKSLLVKDCNGLIDVLRDKLERKAYENATLYFNMEDFKASFTEFRNLLKDFPDSKYREEAFFMVFKASYQYAYYSIEEKKYDRFQASIEAFHSYMDLFPSGKYVKDAVPLFDHAVKQLEKLPKSTT